MSSGLKKKIVHSFILCSVYNMDTCALLEKSRNRKTQGCLSLYTGTSIMFIIINISGFIILFNPLQSKTIWSLEPIDIPKSGFILRWCSVRPLQQLSSAPVPSGQACVIGSSSLGMVMIRWLPSVPCMTVRTLNTRSYAEVPGASQRASHLSLPNTALNTLLDRGG